MTVLPRLAPPLLVVALATLAHAQERETAPLRLEAVRGDAAAPRPLFPRFDLDLVAQRPAGLTGVPELGAQARYATLSIAGRTVVLAFERPEGAFALGRLFLADGTEIAGRARPAGEQAFAVQFDGVRFGTVAGRVALRYRGTDLEEAVLETGEHRRGRVALAGSLREVLLFDGDADGRYDGPADRWIALRPERAKAIPTLRLAESMLLHEPQIPFEEDGRAFHVTEVSTDGTRCTLVLGLPRIGMEEVLERRYREIAEDFAARFAKEAPEFARRYGLDPERARVSAPAPWARQSLAEGLREAKRQGKPLLVHFFVETNPWCYRYDHYSFPDAEVDALLKRFVLVRIDAQKDPDKAYESSGARGIPMLLPMTSDGKPVEFRLRTRDSDGRVTDLRSPEKAIVGWQRPQELVTNLQRILGLTY